MAWGTNNAGGSLKKSVATAIIVSVGNCGGIVSSFIYPKEDGKHHYRKGHAVCLAYCGITIVCAMILWAYGVWANKQKAARNAARGHAWTDEEKKELEDRGDHNDWFVYTI
jgi:hypothetical protein